MLVATRKKSWRLDGHKLDRQRDWLGVSKTHSISTARGLRRAAASWTQWAAHQSRIPSSRIRLRRGTGPGAAQHNRPLPSPNFRHRTEREDTPPPREETATADDDLVRVVNVPLVADVIQPADVRAVAREYPVAPGVGEEPAEFRRRPVALLVPATLLHGGEE